MAYLGNGLIACIPIHLGLLEWSSDFNDLLHSQGHRTFFDALFTQLHFMFIFDILRVDCDSMIAYSMNDTFCHVTSSISHMINKDYVTILEMQSNMELEGM